MMIVSLTRDEHRIATLTKVDFFLTQKKLMVLIFIKLVPNLLKGLACTEPSFPYQLKDQDMEYRGHELQMTGYITSKPVKPGRIKSSAKL